MAAQHCTQGRKILGGLKSVKIVRPFAENQTSRGELIESLAVAQSGATPIVALKDNDGAVEMKSFHRKQVPATLPKLLKDVHSCGQTL
jgi:hypothetical protein